MTDQAGTTQTRERNVTTTFDGTQYATITVDGQTFEVDLSARAGDRGVRERNTDRTRGQGRGRGQ